MPRHLGIFMDFLELCAGREPHGPSPGAASSLAHSGSPCETPPPSFFLIALPTACLWDFENLYHAWHRAGTYRTPTCVRHTPPHQHFLASREVVVFLVPCFLWGQRHRGTRTHAQGHNGGWWQSWGLNPGLPDSRPCLCPCVLPPTPFLLPFPASSLLSRQG